MRQNCAGWETRSQPAEVETITRAFSNFRVVKCSRTYGTGVALFSYLYIMINVYGVLIYRCAGVYVCVVYKRNHCSAFRNGLAETSCF